MMRNQEDMGFNQLPLKKVMINDPLVNLYIAPKFHALQIKCWWGIRIYQQDL